MLEIIFVSKTPHTREPFLADIVTKSVGPTILMKRWLKTEGLSPGKHRSKTVVEAICNVLQNHRLVTNGIPKGSA